MNFTEHVKIREEKFGSVIFDTLKEKVFVTNESGRDILKLLQEGQPVDKIIELLAKAYAVLPVAIRGDVIDFINQLKDNHLIKFSSHGLN